MKTTTALAPVVVSASGCTITRLGLSIQPGMTREEWLKLGTEVTAIAAATLWVLGDYFAYGDQFYVNKKTGKKSIPNGLYEEVAGQIGCAYQTLANAKYVCMAIDRSRRRERVTFNHALEIVSRSEEKNWDFWMDRVENEGLSTKAVREQLRRAKAIYKPEANDTGVTTFLELTRQYVRDFQAVSPKFYPQYREELRKILDPVFQELG